MIIHIGGIPGSGKTLLKDKLKKNKKLVIIDIDEITDKNATSILDDTNFDAIYTTENIHNFDYLLNKLDNDELDKILKQYSTDEKQIIVIIGTTIGVKHADYNFLIKTDVETNYKHVNLRHLDTIHDDYKKMKKILNNDKIPTLKKDLIFLYKLGLRHPFLKKTPNINVELQYFENNTNYITLEANNIYKTIIDLM
jgi:cytidylate kinase